MEAEDRRVETATSNIIEPNNCVDAGYWQIFRFRQVKKETYGIVSTRYTPFTTAFSNVNDMCRQAHSFGGIYDSR